MTLTISGQPYRAASPSLLHHTRLPVSIGFDGTAWRVHVRQAWADRPFASRAEAAQIVADALTIAAREYFA